MCSVIKGTLFILGIAKLKLFPVTADDNFGKEETKKAPDSGAFFVSLFVYC